MTTNSLEASDAAVGAVSTAPRVTLDDLKAAVHQRFDVTADAALEGDHISPKSMKALGVLSLCILVLHNGWTVVGKSAPASVENFNPEIGADLAFKDALTQMWPLMGFNLRCHLYQLEQGMVGAQASTGDAAKAEPAGA